MGLLVFLFIYLLGGITLIPGAIWLFIYLHPIKPTIDEDGKVGLKAGEIEESLKTGIEAHKVGWITVTHEYLESVDEINSSTPAITDTTSNKSAYSTLYKLVKNSDNSSTDTELHDKNPATDKTPDLANSTSISSSNDKLKAGSLSQKKHRYYAVLKHGNLFLYKNEKLKDVKHVIVLSNHFISIWPKGLTDAQLFTKYSSIAIMRKNWSRVRRLSDNLNNPDLGDDLKSEINLNHVLDPNINLTPPPGSFFIYCDNNSNKEDWYFALIRATKEETQSSSSSSTNGISTSEVDTNLNPNIYAKTLHFETSDMINLIQTLYSSEGQLYTKWLNAITGRLFLSLQKTEVLSNYLKMKIYKKLNKIKTPGFLDKFQINKLEPGHSAPFFTFPELLEINPNGELLVKTLFHYLGSMSIQISTKVNINLGSRFKNREVDVLLSITLVKLEGPLLIKFKPPPLSRIWYTFEKEPLMTLKIEPIISSRQFSYNIITNSIEKKFKEAVKESLVMPHWDDVSFFDSSNELFRGGIWDPAPRKPESEQSDISVPVGDDLEFDGNQPINRKTSTTDLSPIHPSSSSKLKFSSTLNEISRKMKMSKLSFDTESVTSVGSSENNSIPNPLNSPLKSTSTTSAPIGFGNNVSMSSSSSSPSLTPDSRSMSSKKSMNTLKKIGKWYFKDGQNSPTSATSETEDIPVYTPPEMILNRRPNRKNSNPNLSQPISSTTEVTPPLPPKISISQNHNHTNSPSYDFGSTFTSNDHMISGSFQSMKHARERSNKSNFSEYSESAIQRSIPDSDSLSIAASNRLATRSSISEGIVAEEGEVQETYASSVVTSELSEKLDLNNLEDLIKLDDSEIPDSTPKLGSGSNSSGQLLHRKPPPTPPTLPPRSNVAPSQSTII